MGTPASPASSTTTSNNDTTEQPTTTTPDIPITNTPTMLSRNRDHQALNDTWRTYFAQQAAHAILPILAENLLPRVNIPWGPDAHAHNGTDLFRIIFGNQNGIPRVNDTLPSWASTMDFLCGLNASLFAFTEPNLQWDSTLLHEAKTIQRRFFTHGHLTTSESDLQFPTSYKPGGTCIGVNGKWTTRIRDSGVDPTGQGRWSYVIISGRDAPDIIFISAYRVCQKARSKAGPLTSYAQQWTMSRIAGNPNPDPRNDFISDLIHFVQEKRRLTPLAVNITLDANEHMGEEATGLQRLTTILGLTDVHGNKLGDQAPATYTRGSKQIDYGLVCSGLLPYVIRCGFGAFHDGPVTDHRWGYMDIDLSGYFGGGVTAIEHLAGRALKSNSPREVAKYRELLHKHLTCHNIPKRLERLRIIEPEQWLPIHEAELNEIDRRITEGMLSAEQKACKKRRLPWSPALKAAQIEVEYWLKTISSIRNNINYRLQLERLLHKLRPPARAKFDLDKQHTYKEASAHLRAARRQRYTVMSKATDYRAMFLHEQAAAAALSSDVAKEKILKGLIKSQDRSEAYKRLHHVFKPANTGAISHLEVPAGDWQWPYNPKQVTEWTREYDTQKVEDHLFARNITHFGQAKETPWTKAPFDNIPFDGSGPIAESILDGTYLYAQTGSHGKYIQLLLDALQRRLPDLSVELSNDDISKGLRVWKEITSTSPSNRHLGHYKALLSPDGREQNETTKYIAEDIMEVHSKMTALCAKLGISLHRWQDVVTAMLEKDTGSPKLHRLRVIHLLEADLNLLIKIIIARRFVWHGEQHGTFGEAQAGGRPGRSANDVVLQKELTYDIAHRTLISLAMMENDATACFDRMIPSLVNIALRSQGVPAEIARLIGTTLVKMRYRIKTKLGISTRHYSHTSQNPIFGTGQGSAGSMAFWLLISTILFNIMSKIAHGLHFSDPQGNDSIQRTMEGFVDDTDVAVNDANSVTPATPTQLIQKLQTDAQHWERLLFISGGKLELNKCFFYLLIWKFNDDGMPSLMTKAQLPHKLMITQGNDNEPTEIDHKDCATAHRTLGVMKAPNLSQAGETKRLAKKCKDHAKAILSNSVSSTDSAIAYRVYHLTSIGYSLSTTYLHAKALQKIQGPAVSAFLATSGFNRNMKRALVFTPRHHGGIGMVPLLLLQGQKCITLLRRHTLHRTELGKQIRIDLAWIQQEAGTAHPFLERTQDKIDYVHDGWISGIRRFLQLAQAEIKFPCIPKPQTYRHGDSYLMEVFRDHGASIAELKTLNRCRLYFQVARTSDIANIAGTQLYDHVLPLERDQATTHRMYPKSTDQWPRQPRPGIDARKLWKKHIKKAFLRTDKLLQNPLGRWTVPAEQRDRRYPTIYDARRKVIHQDEGQIYQQLPILHVDRRTIQADLDSPTPSIRTPGYPVDSVTIQNNVLFAQYTDRNARASTAPPGTTHHHRFGHLPNWIADLLQYTTIYEEHIHLLDSSPSIVVTDGGMEGGKGYFGVIVAVNTIIIARARGVARGDPRTMDSFRAEAYGFLAGVCLLRLLTPPTVNEVKSSIHTDSASLLARLLRATATYVPTGFWLKPDSDIIMQLAEELKTLPNLKRHYVKGHQDSKKKKKDLTIPELYNIEADAEATIMRFQMRQPAHTVIPFPASTVNIYIRNQVITSSLNTRLHEELTCADYWDYLESKYNWTTATRKLIAWEIFHKLLSRQLNKPHQQLLKYSIDWLPTGHEVHRHNPLEEHRCPHCKTVYEKNAHLLRCPHPIRLAQRTRFLSVTLHNFFHTSNTAQPIRELISKSLLQWFRDPTSNLRFPRTHSMHRAATHQQAIGWQHFLRGRIATSIIDFQETYHRDREHDDKHTGHAWAKKLINTLWGHFHAVWKLRCDERHKLDTDNVSKQHTFRVHGRARACYAALPDMPLAIRSHHYFTTIEAQLDTGTRKIEEWLAHAEPLIQQGRADMAQEADTQPDIRAYFQRLPAA